MSSAAAATLDIEKMLWVPRPMIVVPELPSIAGRVYHVPGNTLDIVELLKEIYAPHITELLNSDTLLYTTLSAKGTHAAASASRFKAPIERAR